MADIGFKEGPDSHTAGTDVLGQLPQLRFGFDPEHDDAGMFVASLNESP